MGERVGRDEPTVFEGLEFLTILLLMAEIRRSPVEVGSLSHYLQGFSTIPGCLGFQPSTVVLCAPIFRVLVWILFFWCRKKQSETPTSLLAGGDSLRPNLMLGCLVGQVSCQSRKCEKMLRKREKRL